MRAPRPLLRLTDSPLNDGRAHSHRLALAAALSTHLLLCGCSAASPASIFMLGKTGNSAGSDYAAQQLKSVTDPTWHGQDGSQSAPEWQPAPLPPASHP